MKTQTHTRRARTAGRLAAVLTGLTVLVANATGCAPEPAPTQDAGPAATAAPAAVPQPIDTDAPAPMPSADPDAPTEAPDLPVVMSPLHDPVEFGTGVTVTIESVTATTVSAQTPGEVSGAAVVIVVAANNASTAPIDLGSAVVTLAAADGEYGIGTTAGSDAPLSGSLEPGGSAEGSYVFMLDPATDRAVEVTVGYAAGAPLARFEGTVTR